MKRGLVAFTLLLCLGASASGVTHYVDLNNSTPTPPYTNWSAAAASIQDAIDASSAGDLILVTNGLYKTGSRTAADPTPCRIAINKSVTVRSVNGPQSAIIEGHSEPGNFPWSLNSVRCAYLTNDAMLIGFTLTNGSVRATSYRDLGDLGGGAYAASASAVLSNCIIINCAAYGGGGAYNGTIFRSLITNCIAHIGGGGAYSANLDRCDVIWNTTDNDAGGLYYCQATNCNINYNLALFGGGAYGGAISQCTVYGNYAPASVNFGGGAGGGLNSVDAKNSIIYYNVADVAGNDTIFGTFTNCCSSTPLAGSGNITNAPLFIDTFGFPGNFHLQTNSPCINAGNNTLVSGTTDLDGRPRLVGPKVDMGAFEFQGGATNDFLRWLSTWHLPTDISSDFADPDGDGLNNWQEWRAGTNPTDALSALKMLSLKRDVSGITVSWQSVTNVTYYLQRGTSLGAGSSFSSIKSNILGQAGTTTNKDTSATGSGPFFYRVGVQ